ncbi:MarR family winged helix-turn-helix transcriptional regulator [Marinactinospora rubrisoli]|uniref:MarR family winged helix-turn-helix transcriptional regulator n=1 Tax=Marinactinospora rubrisoli TaxID=2715399 RepID=A0ABW2KE48_9ACTN
MPLAERLGSHLKRTVRALDSAKQAALKPVGLTVPQYAALLELDENPGISAAALARACGVTPPTMNTVLRNLQDQGLIERTTHEWHRNVLEIRLTDKGREAVNRADARAVPLERGLAAEFTPEERKTLLALLARCADYLESPRAD